jgi:hypothetical protein
MRGMGSTLGHGIINGCPIVAGSVPEVVGIESGGIMY